MSNERDSADKRRLAEEALESLRLAELFEKLDKVDMEEIRLDKMLPVERVVEELKADSKLNSEVRRYTRKKAKKKKQLHWKTRRKKEREYYRSFRRYRRMEQKAELLATGAEGWWKHVRKIWSMHKVPVELTKDEWINVVWPALEGRVPVIHRYQTKFPVSLDNIYVTDSDNPKHVLFDGKEYLLRSQGYIL